MTLTLLDMIELNDSDELVREIDRRCESRDWDGLIELRERCHLAVERGKQLWGVAAHAEYRLALEAPGAYAARILDAVPGRFANGPLAEVAASTHSWSELKGGLSDGPVRALTAYERVVRGEDLSSDPELIHQVAMFELPLSLQSWEPQYPLANYRSKEGRFDKPFVEILSSVAAGEESFELIPDRDATDALLDLTRTWTDESNGTARAVAVEGGVSHALCALGTDARTAVRISARSALAAMAWAGASGGAHGRRSGMAAGRSKAWWAIAGVAGVLDEWPLEAGELGTLNEKLEWWTWDAETARDGWSLRLIAVDPNDSVALAIEASDAEEG